MLTSVLKASRRMQDSSANVRNGREEAPSRKKVKLDVPVNSPTLSPIKGPLDESGENASASFIAKCFYGLRKSQVIKENVPVTPDNRSLAGRAVSKCVTETSNSSRSQLDELMMDRIAKSPIKQAVLQTCSPQEFRKMYKHEYKQLEMEIQKKNCRQTRQTYHSIAEIKKEKLDYSSSNYSSDDEVHFRLDNSHDCKIGAESQLEKSDLVYHSVQKLGPQKLSEKELQKHLNESTPKKTENITGSKKTANGTISNADKCLQGKTSTYPDQAVPNSERKFFKTRSPSSSMAKGSLLLGRAFNLCFMSKMKGNKKKLSKQKRQSKPASHKSKRVLQMSKHSPEKTESSSPASGFIFAPGFLTEESSCEKLTNGKILEEDSERLEINRSNICTYGSPLSKDTSSEYDSSSGMPDDANNLSGHPQTASLSGHPQTAMTVKNNGYKNSIPVAMKESQLSPRNKLFPIFEQKHAYSVQAKGKQSPVPKTSIDSLTKWSRQLHKGGSNSQMIIDAGQKKIGATQCSVCSMVYCHADPEDETDHDKFHKRLLEVLKFPGWKKERVVQEYPEDAGRVIMIMHDDIKYAKKKVEEINEVMGRELGFPENLPALNHPYYKVFLYVEDKYITGCCVAEPVTEGYRIMPGDLDNKEESGQRPWCCSIVSEPVCVGISRLWVVPEKRKSGVATKLIDCVRQWFNYGSLIHKHMVAFSDPTPDGRKFAQKYVGAPTFLVYKYNHG